ncbi:MAG: Flp pilus assembly protein CpaB [Caulobacteraceae bacterium]|nr:Flp pilus assembly protein CpaB [Caulobacteraceae bacterium]
MRLGTIISLGASAVFGVGALFVARLWLPSHAAHAAPTPPPAETGLPVVVATAPIVYGAKLDAKFLKVTRLPVSAAPAGAFTSVDQVMNQPGGPPTALAQIAAQEPILPGKISGPGQRLTLSALINPNMRAYTIGVTEISGAAGHVMPGDRVDVVLTRDVTPSGGMEGSGGRRFASQVVLQDLRVLGMDQNANPTTTQAVVARTATLEVPVQDAVRLALAAQTGTLSLALRHVGEDEVAPVRTLVTTDLSAGAGTPVDLRGPASNASPVRRHASARTHAVEPAGDGAVTVVQGEAVTSQKVALERTGAAF